MAWTMPKPVSPVEIVTLPNAELLNLYLSLPPASRDMVFINTAHAAKITGVSVRTIQLWIEVGAVQAIVVGRKYRIVLESLRIHLENQMNGSSLGARKNVSRITRNRRSRRNAR